MARFHHILTESADGVQTITMNRPETRNALCPLLIEELTRALNEAATCNCAPRRISRKACWPSNSAAAPNGRACTPRWRRARMGGYYKLSSLCDPSLTNSSLSASGIL